MKEKQGEEQRKGLKSKKQKRRKQGNGAGTWRRSSVQTRGTGRRCPHPRGPSELLRSRREGLLNSGLPASGDLWACPAPSPAGPCRLSAALRQVTLPQEPHSVREKQLLFSVLLVRSWGVLGSEGSQDSDEAWGAAPGAGRASAPPASTGSYVSTSSRISSCQPPHGHPTGSPPFRGPLATATHPRRPHVSTPRGPPHP